MRVDAGNDHIQRLVLARLRRREQRDRGRAFHNGQRASQRQDLPVSRHGQGPRSERRERVDVDLRGQAGHRRHVDVVDHHTVADCDVGDAVLPGGVLPEDCQRQCLLLRGDRRPRRQQQRRAGLYNKGVGERRDLAARRRGNAVKAKGSQRRDVQRQRRMRRIADNRIRHLDRVIEAEDGSRRPVG